MGSLLERYGKGDDTSTAPSDAASVIPCLPCVAQFAEDGMWYRARVIKVLDQDKVEVNYIDFGNSEVVRLSAIRQEIPFIEVPQQCLQLVLRGIEPKTGDGHWPAETIRVLSQMIVGQDCVAAIKGEKLPGYPLVVRLFLPDGTDVAHTLLSRGLVKKSDLSEEESPQFYPRKPRGPGKAKQVKSSRSITETRAHAQMISSREAECMLAHTELPGEGIRFDVTITHIERPDCLFIQRVPPTDDDAGFSDDPDPTLESATVELQSLEDIMAKINEPDFFKNYTPLTTATDGMLCCARYSEDDMWYRAQVKSLTQEKPLEVRVVYVDYGTTEVVTGDRLRGFPSELLELPTQSTRCFLADIRPPDTTARPMMDDGCWPVSTMEALIQLVAGKKLVAQTLFTGPPASVILYEHRARSDGSVEQVSVGYMLAQRGLAKFTDYENIKSEESDNHEEGSCEVEERSLDCQEAELILTSEAAAAGAESKNTPSSDLLEKMFPLQTGVATAPVSKQKLLTPSELSNKSDNQSSNYNSERADTVLSSPTENNLTTGNESHDQEQAPPQPVTSDHTSSVTSAVSESNIPKVNQDSVESSV